MKTILFFREIFIKFPSLVIFNIIILLILGVVDSCVILTIAPVVDMLVNSSLENTSKITRYIIDILSAIGISVSLWKLLFIFLFFNVLRSLIFSASRYFILKTKYTVLRSVLLGTFEDFFKARWYFFSINKEGILLNTFMREIAVVGDAFGALANYLAQITQCILFAAVPFLISWKVASISFVSAILFAVPFSLIGKVSYRLGKVGTATANQVGSVIQESLTSAKVILGFGNQRRSLSLLSKGFDDHRRATLKYQTINSAIPQAYFPTGILVLIIALLSGRYFSVPISDIAVILYSFLRIVPLIGSLSGEMSALHSCLPSYEQVMSLRNQAKQYVQRTGTINFTGIQNSISIQNLSFSYPGCEQVLEDVDVVIPKGKMVALVGKSGAGKSTLIDMIMGFNEPSKGEIMIDDVPLQNFDINSYRQNIGYVPQTNIVFNMSIKDNLLWAKADATEEQIHEACMLANAIEFIERLPDRYDTLVGDRGVRLSGGQIQRVALARAVLRNPALLILDEATSSLDTESERLIQDAIERISHRTTIILIAHRLSTVINADYIYVMDAGRVIEEGTYADLVAVNGNFKRMVDNQVLIA